MRRLKTILILIIVLTSNVSLAFGATNEGYGEDSQALGQFVDTYDDLNNVSVIEDVVRNATLNAMELNSTEVVNKTVVWTPVQLREHDYHPSYNPAIVFTKFADKIQMLSSPTSSLGQGNIFITVNRDWIDGKYLRWRWQNSYGSGRVYLMDGDYDRSSMVDFPSNGGMNYKGNGVLQTLDTTTAIKTSDVLIDASGGIEDNVTILVRLQDSWTSTIVYLDVFWLEINEGAGGAGNIISWDMSTGGTVRTMEVTGTLNDYGRLHGGDIENYKFFSGGYETDGYFTSTDYLSSPLANGSILVQMENTTIPANTAITIEFSDDNSTWILNDWQPLFGGLESIDLRDLNYSTGYYTRHNLSSTDPTATPRVYQSRLITTIGNSTGGVPSVGGGINSATILMLILLFTLAILIYWGIKRR